MACTETAPQIPAQGEIAGQPIRTTVDSDIARYFLEHYLKGERVRPELDTTIAAIEPDFDTSANISVRRYARKHSGTTA